jgi:hypothetical protein
MDVGNILGIVGLSAELLGAVGLILDALPSYLEFKYRTGLESVASRLQRYVKRGHEQQTHEEAPEGFVVDLQSLAFDRIRELLIYSAMSDEEVGRLYRDLKQLQDGYYRARNYPGPMEGNKDDLGTLAGMWLTVRDYVTEVEHKPYNYYPRAPVVASAWLVVGGMLAQLVGAIL